MHTNTDMFRHLAPLTRSASRALSSNVAQKASCRFFADLVPGVGKGKTSTGLVGLPVDHDAIPKMLVKYQALLDKAKEMPETAEYRIVIEKICNHRINACKMYPDDPEKVEEIVNCGQVEELVVQADDEMEVMEMYLRNRWWEIVEDVEIEYEPSQKEDGDHGDIEWDTPSGKPRD